MLVLSRRPNEKIVFPGINATIQVVAIKPGTVRLGIEAPPEIAVLREEVAARAGAREPAVTLLPDNAAGPTLSQINHLLRDWVDVATIGMALLCRQLRVGLTEATLDPFDQEVGTLRQQMQGMGRQRLSRSRVLVAEDDRNGREVLAGLLRLAGLDAATAGDGAAALDQLRTQGRPDFVLLDMALRGCDAPTVVRAIRRDPAYTGVKIFAVTNGPPDRFDIEGGRGGIDHWFSNPLDPEVLLRDLNQELAGVA